MKESVSGKGSSDMVSKESNPALSIKMSKRKNFNCISKIYPTACVCACAKSYMNKVIHRSIMADRLEENEMSINDD